MRNGLLWSLLLAFNALNNHVYAFDALPRWGQASVVINDYVFVQGGKTDQFNQYSYTAAPNTNDLLLLSLSQPFDANFPPWELVSTSANSTTSQGPAVAWHTLSAYNTSQILLFGGDPGPNSPTVGMGAADSAFVLDVFNRLSPNFESQSPTWAGEPIRRIHHSTVSTITGLIFIIGGEKVDGSNNPFSEHFIFDPNGPVFKLIPSDNGPPDIYGHVSIILPDGRILVFGGISQGSLLPFSTVWVLDTTQSNLSWSTAQVETSSLPSPRRAFVAVLIGDGKILIHGGSDASLQRNFEDGWILDTTKNPMAWTQVPALTQLGPRRDHFAIPSGEEVIFGFGYGNDGPAPANISVYNIPSSTFVPSYTPPAATATITQTLPGPTITGNPNSPHTTASGGNGVTGTDSGVHPTATIDPNDPTGNNGGNNGSNGNPNNADGDSKSNRTTAIAVGTAFGVLGLLGACLLFAWYARRKRRQAEGERQFAALHDDDDGDEESSPHLAGGIPVARLSDEKVGGSHGWGILSSLPLIGGTLSAAAGRRGQRNTERRDMLADEDTREFGDWWDDRRRDGTGGSSWSLRTILSRRMRSREPSVRSGGGTPWREKSDPFGDGASLMMRDEENGYVGIAPLGGLPAVRPQGRREYSYTSTRSGMSYVDPFSDPIEPIQEERREPSEFSYMTTDEGFDPERPSVRPVQPLPTLRTILPVALGGHALSPLSEHTSQNALSLHDPSTSVSSHAVSSENANSPFDGSSMSRATSRTSYEPSRSPPPSNTIIGANAPSSNQPMRRSNSWWARFSRTNLLDRRSSTASRRSMGYDIRDPNPIPRLVAIEESAHSASPERHSPQSHRSNSGGQAQSASRRASKIYGAHGKSTSSLRTADSEAIERMAGTMDVIQRIRTGSHRTSGSTNTTGGLSYIDPPRDANGDLYGELAQFTSPVEMTPIEGSSVPLPPSSPSSAKAPSPAITPPILQSTRSSSSTASSGASSTSPSAGRIKLVRPPSGTTVSSRVQAYERRASQEFQQPNNTNTKQHEERPRRKSQGVLVDYGLVPRASLYVANPDHRASYSSDS
ncbi:hypothetical protein BDQ12DRAFT_637787 [Crucibulum laeve]|uniref:Galactose oxidase n=1 Tax=Crucibulum laeve TaxID=68775 RepID=A0A5C3LKQ4_9AGAR|nr:hypothetical protein BDQ12DRAFT_637787 [Crucibulum laeve]